jgi:putative salt-induced outer membrane protein YdiY
MKYIFIYILFFSFLDADGLDVNSTTSIEKTEVNSLIIIKDKSGLSDDAVRAIANQNDKNDKKTLSIKEVFEATDSNGTVDVAKIQKKWEALSPHPDKFDWLQTKTGEWFKGEIKALYDDKLEFDSEEIGLYTFDLDDIMQIKSYYIISVNIENLALFPGIIRLKDEKLKIIQGENEYEFERKDIVSFAPDGEYERNFWSGKVTVSLDIRNGNTTQYDFSSKVNLQRRTAKSRLSFDYLGRKTSKNDEETANDHRLNEKFDIYLSRHFFWTPLFSEYYTDKYKNIDTQFTAGIGVGYTLVDTKDTEWSISGGPAFLYTKYYTVFADNSIDTFSPALELSTKYELELNKITDITYDYKLTYADENAGVYKHHMVLTIENELTSWLDLDFTGVWDYTREPEEAANGTYPVKSDFQLLIGLGIEF